MNWKQGDIDRLKTRGMEVIQIPHPFNKMPPRGGKVAKYRNKNTVVDGIKFDSKKEADRYGQLKILQKAGLILDLKLQVKHVLVVNGVSLGFYKADFTYIKRSGEVVIEDVKSEMTRKIPVYRIKKKLVKAIYGIDILET